MNNHSLNIYTNNLGLLFNLNIDTLDNSSVIPTKERKLRDNTLNPLYISEIYHLFDIDTHEYVYSTIIYTKTRIKGLSKAPSARRINIIDYYKKNNKRTDKFASINSAIIYNSIYEHTSNKPLIIETNYPIYGITNSFSKIKKEQQIKIHSNLWELNHVSEANTSEVVVTKSNTNNTTAYLKAKSTLSDSLFPTIDYTASTLTQDIINRSSEFEIVRLSTVSKLIDEYSTFYPDIDFSSWTTNPIRPCHYKYGIEQTSEQFDINSYYIYFSDAGISSWLSDTATRQNSAKFLFRLGIALLYTNGYLTNSNNELNIVSTDLIIYAILTVLRKYFIKGQSNGTDWIPDMNLEKFLRNVVKLCQEDTIKESLDAIKANRNGCVFPKDWTADMKKEWKDKNGIKRNNGQKQKERSDKGIKRGTQVHKQHKSHKKHKHHKEHTKPNMDNQSRIGMKYNKGNEELIERAKQLKQEGLSNAKIGEILNVSGKTIGRWLNQ